MSEREVVELRVHGVSGTPPEELLDCPLVEQLAGDNKAGFYKPRLYEEERDPRRVDGKPAGTGPRLEGYAWGGLTSGAPTRALWLLLLPFTMTNVAPRLRPAASSRTMLWLLWFVSRLMALSMTALIVTSLAGVGVDLFGWQCGPGTTSGPDCGNASPGWVMHPLLAMSVEHRIAVGALLPLAVVVLLWQLSGRTINSYEGVPIDSWESIAAERQAADATEPNLRSRWMWHNEYQVRRLRHLHLLTGCATILWIASYPFRGTWDTWRIVVACALGVYLVVMLCVPAYTGRREIRSLYAVSIGAWVLLGVYAAFIARALIWGSPLPAEHNDVGLPGYAGTALAIFVIQLCLFVAFAVLIVVMSISWAKTRDKTAPRALWDCAGIVMAMIGVFLGAVFSSGVYVFATAWLTTGSVKPGFGEVSNAAVAFHVPNVIRDANRAYAISTAALVVMIALIVAAFAVNRLLRVARLRTWPTSRYRKILVSSYSETVVAADPARAKQVGKAFWLARQVDFAHRYLAGVMAVGALITGFFTTLLIVSARHPDSASCWVRWHEVGTRAGATACPGTGRLHTWLWDGWLSARSLQGTGAYLVIMSLVLLVGLGAAAFKAQSTRRSVGILWDLASFWPRSAHPFAAPCYAERAVPDLVTRVYWYTRERGACVVLAAHSQGTVIGMATLFQLGAIDQAEAREPGDATTRSVAYLSFGCVLRRLYARYFPAYFSSGALARLRDEVLTTGDGPPRWRNLWRYSDYLGGQVMSGPAPVDPAPSPIDVRSTDPDWARRGGDTNWPKANRHSYYWGDPVFAPTVSDLAARLPAGAETDT